MNLPLIKSQKPMSPKSGQVLKRGSIAILSALAISALFPSLVSAHGGAVPPSLKTVPLPQIPGLLDGPQPIVVNQTAAIALGKALFWDMNVGSDGMACGSCHFHAGADSRSKNQFSPGKKHLPAAPSVANSFDPNDPRGPNLANFQLHKSDFPLYQFDDSSMLNNLSDYGFPVSIPSSDTYNAVASAGTFSGEFTGIAADGTEQCAPLTGAQLDNTFQVGGFHTRRVEPRNAPTFINAVFFDRQFWDGRANHLYNGVSPWGPRDPNAYIWTVDGDNVAWKTRIELPNASIASLSMGPPGNEFEMSCRGRTLKDVARKLLQRRPLENQDVHPQDGALGTLVHTSGKGLNTTYENLIKQAFADRYWKAGTKPVFGRPSYSNTYFSQAESNFSLFFGLAIQLYASTLISDDTPFDNSNVIADATGVLTDQNGVLTADQLQGLTTAQIQCFLCHSGPLFTKATNRNEFDIVEGFWRTRTMVDRIQTPSVKRLQDTGFRNNGSVPSEYDPGIANVDDFNNPLAFSVQYMAQLAGRKADVREPLPKILACDFGANVFLGNLLVTQLIPDPADPLGLQCPINYETSAMVPTVAVASSVLPTNIVSWATAIDPVNNTLLAKKFGPSGNLFKVPQLYNVALTGPYMHNGGMSTLKQVMDHYLIRGGNFNLNNTYKGNKEMSNELIVQQGITDQQIQKVISFLESLTDDRVRYERAPFDHPQLFVPYGHPGDQTATTGVNGLAEDILEEVPAVGANGRATPLPTFEETLPN